MASGEQVLESLTEMDRYVRLMSRMTHLSGILKCVRAYLWGWNQERVFNLQKFDGGWAPFDSFQQPIGVYSAADVHRISTALHAQCKGLTANKIELVPDMLELDMFFFFADQLLNRLQDRAEAGDSQSHFSATSLH